MPFTLEVDLHKTARSVNIALLILLPVTFLAGYFVSFYFHFLTVTVLFLNIINVFYLFVQRQHALLRNFGVLAQARYFLESIGPELRQYFFASDTEERPFNREERTEVYRMAYNVDSTYSFGSEYHVIAMSFHLRDILNAPIPQQRFASSHVYSLIEAVCVVLLLSPRISAWGAVLCLGVMMGAVIAHATVLGFDGSVGTLFLMALLAGGSSLAIIYRLRDQIPFIRDMLFK